MVSCSLDYQEVNIRNMNVELVAQMFKNYQSNVLFHLEGMSCPASQNATVLLI
jgi:hypothetical protein